MGPEGLRELVALRLVGLLPRVLAHLEAELGLAAGALKGPEVLAPVEARLLAVEKFPAYLVTLLDVPTVQVEDWGPPVTLRLETNVRVLAFARGGSYEQVGTARDRYMLALRRAMLSDRYFGRPDAGLLFETYRESYSEVGNDRSKRSIAAGFAEFRTFTTEAVPAL